jgi:hypothetical protein
MSKKTRRKRKQQRRSQAQRRIPWLWMAAGGAVVVVLAALLVSQPWSGADPEVTPEVFGSPRLKVDQSEIDHGYVRYNVPVRSTFRLSNVGDQPLKIVDTPQVLLVKGC